MAPVEKSHASKPQSEQDFHRLPVRVFIGEEELIFADNSQVIQSASVLQETQLAQTRRAQHHNRNAIPSINQS